MGLTACSSMDQSVRGPFPSDQAAAISASGDPMARGKIHFSEGRYGLALTHFQAALSADPESVRALNAVAASYDQMGRFDLADRYYDKALALAPESVDVLNNLGFSYLLRGDRVTGERYLRLAATLDGDNAVVDRNLRLALGEPVRMPIAGNPLYTLADLNQIRGRTVAANRVEDAPEIESEPKAAAASSPADPPIVSVEARPQAKLVRLSRGVHELRTAVGMARARTPAVTERAVAAAPVTPVAVEPEPPAELAAIDDQPETAPVDTAATGDGPTLVIANGTGRPGMAGRMRDYLTENGVTSTGISNETSYDSLRSVIRYRPDSEAMAKALAEKLPVTVALEPDSEQAYHLRLILGADLLDFDDDRLGPITDAPSG